MAVSPRPENHGGSAQTSAAVRFLSGWGERGVRGRNRGSKTSGALGLIRHEYRQIDDVLWIGEESESQGMAWF